MVDYVRKIVRGGDALRSMHRFAGDLVTEDAEGIFKRGDQDIGQFVAVIVREIEGNHLVGWVAVMLDIV